MQHAGWRSSAGRNETGLMAVVSAEKSDVLSMLVLARGNHDQAVRMVGGAAWWAPHVTGCSGVGRLTPAMVGMRAGVDNGMHIYYIAHMLRVLARVRQREIA